MSTGIDWWFDRKQPWPSIETMNANPPGLLSVVVPAHNEAQGIVHAIDVIVTALASCGMELEVIVVDDGSGDGTFERVTDMSRKDERIKGLRFTRNFGKEAALLAGLRVAAGAAVVTIDADLQHPPALITSMIEEWRKGAMVVDAVKRSRENDGVLTRLRAGLFNSLLSDWAESSWKTHRTSSCWTASSSIRSHEDFPNASASIAVWPTGSGTGTRAFHSMSRRAW